MVHRHLVAALILLAGILHVGAQGTAFTYNGRLNDGGQPASGTNYGMVFYLYDVPTNGSPLGNLGIASVTVSNGLFATPLDFGGQFDGTPRWLEIAVQKNGGALTTLSPRQPILSVPYAVMAGSASNLLGILPSGQLAGQIASENLPVSPVFSGSVSADTFSGDGFYLTNLNPMSLASGFVGAQLFATNQFNSFNGNFWGFHSGDGNYLTNLNPMSLSSGFVGAQLFLTNQFNSFNGNFWGFHSGDGNYLTNLNPMSLSSGFVGAQLFATNQFNSFNGSFWGYHSGDGAGLTNVPVDAVSGGLTTNISVLVPGGGTNILCFTNGILRAIQ